VERAVKRRLAGDNLTPLLLTRRGENHRGANAPLAGTVERRKTKIALGRTIAILPEAQGVPNR